MANNSSGARSVLYGKTIDHVLEARVVLADGAIAHFGPIGGDELEAACRGRIARIVDRAEGGRRFRVATQRPSRSFACSIVSLYARYSLRGSHGFATGIS